MERRVPNPCPTALSRSRSWSAAFCAGVNAASSCSSSRRAWRTVDGCTIVVEPRTRRRFWTAVTSSVTLLNTLLLEVRSAASEPPNSVWTKSKPPRGPRFSASAIPDAPASPTFAKIALNAGSTFVNANAPSSTGMSTSGLNSTSAIRPGTGRSRSGRFEMTPSAKPLAKRRAITAAAAAMAASAAMSRGSDAIEPRMRPTSSTRFRKPDAILRRFGPLNALAMKSTAWRAYGARISPMRPAIELSEATIPPAALPAPAPRFEKSPENASAIAEPSERNPSMAGWR